jgi:hypothetical protein
MAVQTQLMQRMAEAVEHRGNDGNRTTSHDEDLTRKIERFIRLKAPTFRYSDDPLDAADWLKVIETKLDLTVCSDEECVAIAAHQLEGPAKAWWDNYTVSHPNLAFITWLEFCVVFCEQYLLLGGYPKNSDYRPNTRERAKHVQALSESAKRL